MSGFVGVVNFDGEPVDAHLLEHLTQALAFRGPDAQTTWIDGAVGLGHALLRTTTASGAERQPTTLDGRTWIVGDARLDGRNDLLSRLEGLGCRVSASSSDAELILLAHSAWGEACVDHLIGDFAFGVWDATRRRLLCARDQLGIKPLFFAHSDSTVIFSNTLDCVRMHPAVSSRLNETAVADFLMFDLSLDAHASFFADVRRLPPAHIAVWSRGTEQIRRYWTLPIEEPVYYAHHQEYIERFHELLRTSVAERVGGDCVGVLMSGGVDSSSLAAMARQVMAGPGPGAGLRGFTTSYEGHDDEGHYAGLVADWLGMPLEVQGWSDDMAPDAWWTTGFRTPEPEPYPNAIGFHRAYHARVAAHCRVALYGEGPDNALAYEWQAHVGYLLRRWRISRLLCDLTDLVLLQRRLPLQGALPRLFRRRPTRGADAMFPDWFNHDLERRLYLHERWARSLEPPKSPHPTRPRAHGSFGLRLWQSVFQSFDSATTRCPLEVRHPYLDLRMLRYLLAVPAVPWCRGKYLIRRSMEGHLPPPVLKRAKTPLTRDPWPERVFAQGLPPLEPAPGLDIFVDLAKISRGPRRDPVAFWVDFRVWSLSYWLRNSRGGVEPVDKGGSL